MPSYSHYFDIIKIPKHRYAFIKFVTKNHALPIVKRKWHHPVPYNQRLCTLCGTLGDEYHFLLICDKYVNDRKIYIPFYFWRHPSMFKFSQLLSTTSNIFLKRLANYIYIVLKNEI